MAKVATFLGTFVAFLLLCDPGNIFCGICYLSQQGLI